MVQAAAISRDNRKCVVGLQSPCRNDGEASLTQVGLAATCGSHIDEEFIERFHGNDLRNLAVVDIRNKQTELISVGHLSSIEGVIGLPDGKTCLSVSTEGIAVEWDLATRKPFRRYWAGRPSTHFLSATTNGEKILIGGMWWARLIERKTGRLIQEFEIPAKFGSQMVKPIGHEQSRRCHSMARRTDLR